MGTQRAQKKGVGLSSCSFVRGEVLSTGAAHATPSFRTLLVGEKRERKKNKPSSVQQKNIRLSGIFFCCFIRVFRGELSTDRCSRR